MSPEITTGHTTEEKSYSNLTKRKTGVWYVRWATDNNNNTAQQGGQNNGKDNRTGNGNEA